MTRAPSAVPRPCPPATADLPSRARGGDRAIPGNPLRLLRAASSGARSPRPTTSSPRRCATSWRPAARRTSSTSSSSEERRATVRGRTGTPAPPRGSAPGTRRGSCSAIRAPPCTGSSRSSVAGRPGAGPPRVHGRGAHARRPRGDRRPARGDDPRPGGGPPRAPAARARRPLPGLRPPRRSRGEAAALAAAFGRRAGGRGPLRRRHAAADLAHRGRRDHRRAQKALAATAAHPHRRRAPPLRGGARLARRARPGEARGCPPTAGTASPSCSCSRRATRASSSSRPTGCSGPRRGVARGAGSGGSRRTSSSRRRGGRPAPHRPRLGHLQLSEHMGSRARSCSSPRPTARCGSSRCGTGPTSPGCRCPPTRRCARSTSRCSTASCSRGCSASAARPRTSTSCATPARPSPAHPGWRARGRLPAQPHAHVAGAGGGRRRAHHAAEEHLVPPQIPSGLVLRPVDPNGRP